MTVRSKKKGRPLGRGRDRRWLCGALATALACSQPGHEGAGSGGQGQAESDAAQAGQGPVGGSSVQSAPKAPVQRVEVVARYPHDVDAYTQGLFVQDGVLYESTGRNGTSSVRIV